MLTGKWAVDNRGTILLNGKPVTSAGGSIGTKTSASFHALHSFTITASGSGVTFNSGMNTLDFIVRNDALETSLRVDLSGTATPSALSVYGTGVSTSDTLLNNNNNAPMDPHFTLVTPPSHYTPAAGVVGHAYALNSSDSYLASNKGPYRQRPKTYRNGSRPIRPGSPATSPTAGTITKPRFLSRTHPRRCSSAIGRSITSAHILLNGYAPTFTVGGPIPTTGSASFTALHSFKITGLQKGMNTLDFLVENNGAGPTGLARGSEWDRLAPDASE